MSVAAPQTITPEAAKAELWRRGKLAWKLFDCQRSVYDAYTTCLALIVVWEISRRFGKSFLIAIILLEYGIQNPGSVMHYAAPTGKMVRNIFLPNLRVILEDCPEDMRPRIKVSEGVVEFPNGSVIHMAGCEDELKADRLRGTKSHLFVLDEAGFIPCLKYVVTAIAGPQLLTTGGRMLVPSTPPTSPGHHFTELAIRAEANAAYQHRTIYDSSVNGTPEKIAEFMDMCGGEDTDEWQREYLARRVIDQQRAVVPEFSEAKGEVVVDREPPAYFDTYVSMDVGWAPSLTVVLFALWDMERAELYVQDELVLSKMTTDDLAVGVKATEAELWGGYFARVKAERPFDEEAAEVYTRVSDIDLRLIHDMANLHGLDFSPAVKDDKDTAINAVRLGFRKRKIKIHPRCTTLIAHLEAGVWNKRRTQYEFVDGFGHFDAIDALIYLRRHIDESHNPHPHHATGRGEGYFVRPGQDNPDVAAIKELLA